MTKQTNPIGAYFWSRKGQESLLGFTCALMPVVTLRVIFSLLAIVVASLLIYVQTTYDTLGFSLLPEITELPDTASSNSSNTVQKDQPSGSLTPKEKPPTAQLTTTNKPPSTPPPPPPTPLASLPLPPPPPSPSWKNCDRIACKVDGECGLPWSDRKNRTIKCCSDVLYDYLVDVHAVMKGMNLEHFIMYGTLLGAHRDHDVIPWETDLDIVLNASTYDQWESTWKNALWSRGYIVFRYDILRVCKVSKKQQLDKAPWHKGGWFPYIDIYRMDSKGNKVYTNQNANKFYPLADIKPLARCTLRNETVPCPAKPAAVLTSFYGNWATKNPGHHWWRKAALGI